MKTVFRVVVTVMMFLANPGWSIDVTPTGFYYPTGTANLGPYAGWLASGCGTNTGYFSGEYHIGYDIQGSEGDPVYAISDGEVVHISNNGWGTGNVAIFVKHQLSNGNYFLALYGHIRMSLSIGDRVYAGKSIATIGPWSYGAHLHFGVVAGSAVPPAPFGRMDCVNWPSINTFVDPINWITSQTPYANVGHYSDGWHDTATHPHNPSQPILDAYVEHGGYTTFGIPWIEAAAVAFMLGLRVAVRMIRM